MEKIIKVSFGTYYLNKFSRPFRNKKDFIFLILDTLAVLYFDDFEKAEAGNIIIKVDKMSRVFYHLHEKYFSIVFPFSIEEDEEGLQKYRIYDMNSEFEIDSRSISLMRAILKKIDYDSISIEGMLEKIYYDITDQAYISEDLESCFKIIIRLLETELGYIRFDYDPDHEKGKLHPLFHLDINYSANCTYKLGVDRMLKLQEFINLLDARKECRFIV